MEEKKPFVLHLHCLNHLRSVQSSRTTVKIHEYENERTNTRSYIFSSV